MKGTRMTTDLSEDRSVSRRPSTSAAGQEGDLHAVASRGALGAGDGRGHDRQGAGVHDIAEAAHGDRSISSSSVRIIGLDSSGGGLGPLSFSMPAAYPSASTDLWRDK